MKADFHTHTSFSSDTDVPAEQIIKRAIEIGLDTICITDHMDKDYSKDNDLFQLDTKTYYNEIKRLQKLYADQIDIRIGVETGLQPHLGTFYKEYVKQYPFDFVIGSVHVLEGKDPYYPGTFEGKTDEEMYRLFFEETLQNVKQNNDFDVLGHMDYIVRYGKKQEESYSYHRFADIIDEILKHLILQGKGLELNTAGWKYGLNFCHPHTDILKRYKELGGEIITIGSDGHRPEHIAYGFDRVGSLLKENGYYYYTEFKNRKPIFKDVP